VRKPQASDDHDVEDVKGSYWVDITARTEVKPERPLEK
jgi:hypothetical protein